MPPPPATPKTMPFDRYVPIQPLPLVIADRQWPNRRIEKAPLWCSVDLRDGNQALIDPMDPTRKRRMFDAVVAMGFKEIEVGFPSASQPDFDFVRQLIEEDLIPDDVTIQVLTQCRPELIERTYECDPGCPDGPSSTSTTRRRCCSGGSCSASTRPASPRSPSSAARLARKLEDTLPGTDVRYEYSPRELHRHRARLRRRDLRGGDGRHRAHAATARSSSTCRPRSRCTRRTSTPTSSSGSTATSPTATASCLSLHPHNDRGCAVAAAELGVMAGADRVEGTLFGNGERTGNVDVVTLAMNLFSQGVDPSSTSVRHRRPAPRGRVLQPPARPPAPPVRRRPRLHRVLGLAPGRHQEGHRRAAGELRRNGACRTCPSTPSTSAARTRPSSGSTASPARAAWPTS